MRLAVTLGLRGLVEALPLHPLLGVRAVELLAELLDDREHEAVAQVAVVRDREHAAARLLLVGVHPLPQVDRIVAAVRGVHGERLDLPGLVAVVTEDDVAVEVVPAGVRRPLVADEGGEAARLVVMLGGRDVLLPGARYPRLPGKYIRSFGNVPWEKATMISIAASAPLPDWIISYHFRPVGSREHFGLPREEVGEEAHVVRVVADHEEIERAGELHRLAAGGRHLLPAGEAIGIARAEPGAEGAGVHGGRRVEVRVTEVRTRGIVAARVGRVQRLARVHLRGLLLVELAGVVAPDVRASGDQPDDGESRPARMGRSRVAVVMDRPVRRGFTGYLLPKPSDGSIAEPVWAVCGTCSTAQGYSEARRHRQSTPSGGAAPVASCEDVSGGSPSRRAGGRRRASARAPGARSARDSCRARRS